MIRKLEGLSEEELDKIRLLVGEAFVSNELFHNWGEEEERREDVLKYMKVYVDFAYSAGELYANEDMTGFIGLEDSKAKKIGPQIKMLFKLFTTLPFYRIKQLMSFINRIGDGNKRYAKSHHIDVLMVCVDKAHQGQGIARELITFAKDMSDTKGVPLLIDTDMPSYAQMYEHMGCKIYNETKADNGVTRFNLIYQ